MPDMKPTIVCLCGSTKFKEAFIEANFRETMAGRIVLSVGWFSHADSQIYAPTETEKIALDELHKRKIDLADEVLILNVVRGYCVGCNFWFNYPDAGTCRECGKSVKPTPYIGPSTRSELEYAQRHGKRVRYLETPCPT